MSSPDDLDDLFGLSSASPAAPAPAKSAGQTGADARKEVRVTVKWNARVQMPDGHVVALRTCDISESGIGLMGERPLASNATLACALAIPDPNNPAAITWIQGTVRTAHVTVRGPDLVYGGIWQNLPADGRDLIKRWIKKLKS